jgi:PAS domain S-box-containing protein
MPYLRKSPDLSKEAWRSMAHRSRGGLLGFPLIFLVLGLSTLNGHAPGWFLALLGVVLLFTGMRAWLVHRFDTLFDAAPRRWCALYLLDLTVLIVLLTVVICHIVAIAGMAPPGALALATAAATAGFGVIVYSYQISIARYVIAMVTLPAIVVLVQAPEPKDWPGSSLAGLGMIVYVLYLLVVTRQLHTERWEGLEANQLLVLRAVELERAQQELRRTHEQLELQVEARTDELRRVSEDYRRVFENAHDPIFIFAPEDERILNANRRACEIYGFSRQQLVGMSLADISENVSRGQAQVAQTLREGVYHNFESVQFRQDGSRMFVEINASAIEYEGRPAILSINRDVTERRRLEELRLAKEAAERADLAKTEFLANMSHEIRTPLAGVIGLADLLLKSGLEGRQQDYATLVQSASESLLRLIDDILDFSKIEAGKLVLERAPFEPRALMCEVCDLLRFRAQEKGIALEVAVVEAVPAWVAGDAARLRQVLLNLIGNAIKFTAAGRVGLEVTAGEPEDARVTFRVRDTGIGIAPEARDHIFSPFSQADSSTSRRFGGTGLGLAISRRIVEQMGGEIGFESTPGEGSLFWFRIPLEATAAPAAAVVCPAGQPAPDRRPRRILVAEDHPINQLVAVRQLEGFGYEVTAVSNGLEALAVLEESAYDLVLLDCQMPEMDGYETARRLRSRTVGSPGPRLPIVALTAHALKEDLQRCLDAGMDDYVTKPFHPDTLRRTVESWLSGRSAASPTGTAPEAGAPQSDEPRLDPTRLQGLRELGRLGGSDLLGSVVARFRQQLLLTALHQALESGDRNALSLHAHTLKGTSAALGALRLSRLCGELERLAAKATLDDCARQLAALADEYDQVLVELAAGG